MVLLLRFFWAGESLRDVILLLSLERNDGWMRGAEQKSVYDVSGFARYGDGITSLRSSVQAVANHHRVRTLNDALHFRRIQTLGEQKLRAGLRRESSRSQKKNRTQFRVHALPIQSESGSREYRPSVPIQVCEVLVNWFGGFARLAGAAGV
jgi:hypothetical protein